MTKPTPGWFVFYAILAIGIGAPIAVCAASHAREPAPEPAPRLSACVHVPADAEGWPQPANAWECTWRGRRCLLTEAGGVWCEEARP